MADENILIRITAVDQAKEAMDSVNRQLKAIRDEMTRRYGEWAGTRSFEKGNEQINTLRQSLVQLRGEIGSLGRLGDLGLVDVERQINSARAAWSAFRGDLGSQAALDAGARLAKQFQDQQQQLKAFFDQATAGYERIAAAQKKAAAEMIANLRRYQQEEEKAYRDRQRFYSQVMPQSNVAQYRAFQRESANNEISLIESVAQRRRALDSEQVAHLLRQADLQEKVAKEQFQFQEQMSTKVAVKYDPTAGRYVEAARELKALGNTAEEVSLSMEYGWRHLIALFDEFQRGQRGAMVASTTAFLRDTGLMRVGLQALMSPWALVGIAGLGVLGAIIYKIQQAYQEISGLRQALADIAQTGGGAGPQVFGQVQSEFRRVQALSHEYAGTTKELIGQIYSVEPAAREAAAGLEKIAVGFAGLRDEDPKKLMDEWTKELAKGPDSFAKWAEGFFNLRGATNAAGLTLEEQVKVLTRTDDKFNTVMAAIAKATKAEVDLGISVRAAYNEHERYATILALTTAYETGDTAAIEQLTKRLQELTQPLASAAIETRELSQELIAQSNAVRAANEPLIKRIELLNQLSLTTAAAAEAQRGLMEGTTTQEQVNWKENARLNDEAKARAGALQPAEEEARQRRIQESHAEAEARRSDLQAQADAAHKLVKIEEDAARQRFTAPGAPAMSEAEIQREIDNTNTVRKARDDAAEADKRVRDQEVRLSKAALDAKIADEHRGTAERISAQEEKIAITRKEVAAGREGPETLAQEETRLANLRRQFADQSYRAAVDAGRAQVEEAKDSVAKIDEVYRDLWKKAIQSGQAPQAFQELTREWIRDVNTARQRAFSEFSAYERDRIQAARDSTTEIIAIYKEWLDQASAIFGKGSEEWLKVQREMVRALQTQTDKIISERLRGADAEVRVLEMQARANQLQRQAQEVARSGTEAHHAEVIAGLQAEIAELQSTAAKEIAIYQEIANTQGISTEQKISSLEKAAEVAMRTSEQEIAAAKKIADEQRKATEEAHKVWTDFFKKVGDSYETYLEEVLSGKGGNLKNLMDGIRKDVIHLGTQLASQAIAKQVGIDLKPGEGFGGLVSGMFSKLFGLDKKEPSEQVNDALKAGNIQRQKSLDILGDIRKLLAEQKQKAEEAAKAVAAEKEKLAATPPPAPGTIPGSPGVVSTGGVDTSTKEWQESNLTLVGTQGLTAKVNKQIADQAQALLNDLTERGVKIHSLGGYEYRRVAGTGELSRHAAGAALDINARENEPGMRGTMPPDMAAIAAAHGARWGGTFRQPDPMHVDWNVTGQAVTKLADAADKAAASLNKVSGASDAPIGPSGKTTKELAAQPYQLGGPVGTDTTLAWLTPGERVLNLRETSAYHRMFGSDGILGFQEGGVAGPWAAWVPSEHPLEEYPWFSGGQAGPPDLPSYGRPFLGVQGWRYTATPWTPPNPATGAGIASAFKLGLSSLGFQEGGIIGQGSREDIEAAVRRSLEGKDRTWEEIMTAMPPRGFAMRGETQREAGFPDIFPPGEIGPSVSGFFKFISKEIPEGISHGFEDVFGKRLQQGPEEVGAEAYKHPLPPIAYDPFTHIGRMGEVPGFQRGGVAASQPGLTSLTTESRGFAPVHLVQAFPGLGKGWAIMAALLGGAAALAGISALFKKDDQEELAKKLLAAPDSGPEATRTTTPLSQAKADAAKFPRFHSGGLATDEMLAVLQSGERVIPRYAEGGVAEDATMSPTYSPGAKSQSTTGQVIQSLTSSIGTVTTGMGTLAQDIGKISSAFNVLGRTTNTSQSALGMFTSELSSIGSVFSSLKSVLGMFGGGGGGGGGGGIGGIFSLLGGLFLEGGGIIPSAQGGMVVDGLGRGGTLAVLHPNEMVLPSHISQKMQDMAAGGEGSAPDIHFHLHTIDQRSGAQFLMSHRDTIAGLYRSSYRSFNPNVPA